MNRKIVILSAFYEPFMSGAEQMVKQILENLGKNYETTLITARLDKNLPVIEQREGFVIRRVGIGHKKIDKFLYPFLAARMTGRFKPDIAHAIMESYAGIALWLSKFIHPKAFRILTLQSGDLDDAKKQKRFWIQIFWKKIHNSPNKITAISNFLAKRAEGLGVPSEKVFVIPNGVDLDKCPQKNSIIDGRVICVARLSWEKGLNFLIKAWPEVVKNMSSAKLVLVGEGGDRKEVERMINELGVKNSVELKGNLPHNQVLAEISQSEIFICPSLAEGLGIVFIEAQACGTTVIGTNVGGIPDVIQDGVNGVLIEPRNFQAISDALIKLLKDKSLAKNLANNALLSVRQYDWKNILEKIDAIYKNAT